MGRHDPVKDMNALVALGEALADVLPTGRCKPSSLRRRGDLAFLLAVHAIEPGVVWIAVWLRELARGPLNEHRPIRAMRQEASRLGIGRAAWKGLIRDHLADARVLFANEGARELLSYLLLCRLAQRSPGFSRQEQLLLGSFEMRRHRESSTYCHWVDHRLPRWAARALVQRAIDGLRGESSPRSVRREFIRVLSYSRAISRVVNPRRWDRLLEEANRNRQLDLLETASRHWSWPVGDVPERFAGWSIRALRTSAELAGESLRMDHSIHNHADDCDDGELRVFHLSKRKAGNDSGWTVVLEPADDNRWRVLWILGVDQVNPHESVRRLSDRWAKAYSRMLSPKRARRGD